MRIGLDDQVGLLDADEAGDRRAVEPLAFPEGRGELGGRDGEIHLPAQDVGEEEPDELDVARRVLEDREDVLLVPRSEGLESRWRARVGASVGLLSSVRAAGS